MSRPEPTRECWAMENNNLSLPCIPARHFTRRSYFYPCKKIGALYVTYVCSDVIIRPPEIEKYK